jgi:hypothetical protein
MITKHNCVDILRKLIAEHRQKGSQTLELVGEVDQKMGGLQEILPSKN